MRAHACLLDSGVVLGGTDVVSTSEFSFVFTATNPGASSKIYYTLLADGAGAPTAADIRAAVNDAGSCSGAFDESAGSPHAVTDCGLDADTQYDLYISIDNAGDGATTGEALASAGNPGNIQLGGLSTC